MTSHLHLAESANQFRLLKHDLIEKHGLGEDDPALLDTLDGETNFLDQLRTLLRRALELNYMAVANRVQMEALEERTEILQARAAQLRAIVMSHMDQQNIKRIEASDFAYTLANGRPKLIGEADPKELPDRFVRVKREVNRTAIMDALKAGEHVPGFSISNGQPHLRSV